MTPQISQLSQVTVRTFWWVLLIVLASYGWILNRPMAEFFWHQWGVKNARTGSSHTVRP